MTNAIQTTVFTISYNWTIFSARNGYLIGYAVIVAEGESSLPDENKNLVRETFTNIANNKC